MHLIDWESLSKPNELGRANLKSAIDMNQALLAKLSWRILTYSRRVWSNVLRAKYGVKDEDGIRFKTR